MESWTGLLDSLPTIKMDLPYPWEKPRDLNDYRFTKEPEQIRSIGIIKTME